MLPFANYSPAYPQLEEPVNPLASLLPWQMPQQQPPPQLAIPQQPRRKRKRTPALTPEEEQSLLGMAVGGVEAVDNLLGLPASSLRDLLAWENPFDQWLSPLSSDNRITGRELLRRYDLAGEEDTWGNFLGGVAVETLLDPTLLVTGPLGTLAKGSKFSRVAGKALTHADEAADVATTPLRQRKHNPGRRGRAAPPGAGGKHLAALGVFRTHVNLPPFVRGRCTLQY